MLRLRYEKKTYQLRGLIFEVRNELKAGWSEDIYHQALVELLQDNHIPVFSKLRRSLSHRNVEVHIFEPDLIVWDTIILELKALPYQTKFIGEHYAQIIHYLKFFEKDLGLLVNFAPARVKIKRVIWDEPELDVFEDYSKIKSVLSDKDKADLRQIRHHILEIAQQYGLGYPETVYRKIVAIEMAYHTIPCLTDFEVPARWNGAVLGSHKTSLLLVADNYLVHIRALLDYPTEYDLTRTKTYLASLGLKFGLVVNFGRRQLQIYGVKAE
jgi:GxxExxY protein